MEVFSAPVKPTVVVDYAHTPDALEKSAGGGAPALRQEALVRVWLRRRSRQRQTPADGAIAEQFADIPVVTDDNPRTEEPRAIINDNLAACWTAPRSLWWKGVRKP